MAKKRRTAPDPARAITVVFDHGGVLSEGFDPIPDIHRAVGGDVEAVASAYWEARAAYDRAELTPAEYWGRVAAAAQIERLSDEEVDDLQDIDNRYWGRLAGPSRELLHDLARNGVRLVLLSNASAPFGAYVRRQEWFEVFEVAIISGEERLAKPDPEIYRVLLEVIAHDTGGVVRPGNVVYFDDVEANVAAARDLGIDAHRWARNGQEDAGGLGAGQASADVGDPAIAASPERPGWEMARTVLTERGVPLG